MGNALRRGWTTGACATAATKAALSKLLNGEFPDPVSITLPGGQTPDFALAHELYDEARQPLWAEAGIIKDAGDDPDVTHGALIIARVAYSGSGSGIVFGAGDGVGTVTKAGLPVPIGEPAINPVPRKMMRGVVNDLCDAHALPPDIAITISVRNGAHIAQKTWNPRLGILGGLSILGTTGIVVPYSCSAWIHSIHRGIDVATAQGLDHIVGSTGDRSEKAAMLELGLPMDAYIDMGDFVGGLLKYAVQKHVSHVTIAGGFAKMVKLAQGARDLHSGRSQVDMEFLADAAAQCGGSPALQSKINKQSSASAVLALCIDEHLAIGDHIAKHARLAALDIARQKIETIDTMVVDRSGAIIGRS